MHHIPPSSGPRGGLSHASLAVILAALVTGCGSSTPLAPSAQPIHASGQGAAHSTDGSTARGTSSSGGASSGTTSAAAVTIALARCMRSHGVPRFPNPNSRTGLFAPGSGVDPGSAAFQSALNGPCRSVAPQAWLSSGPTSGTVGGGS